jgi:FkbM family methyltransferase
MIRQTWNRWLLEWASFYLRSTPWEKGRWRVLRWALGAARRGDLGPAQTRLIRCRQGFRMQVNLSDWLGRHVYVTGEYEPPVARLVQTLLRPGDVFIDVGANIGFFSLLASKVVGSAGRVLAFEPDPQTRRCLDANVRLNNARNVTVHEQALSDRLEMVPFHLAPRDHTGLSSFRCLDSETGFISVQAGPLEAFVHELAGVRLVKIDVEGAESLVLRGMDSLLRRERPDIIIEITDGFLRELGSSAAALQQQLRDLGYRINVIEHDAFIPVEKVSPLPNQFNAYCTTRLAGI